MKTYQYQVIKYVHDHFTGEFVNMGIVLYNPETHFLNCKFTDRSKRITSMFPGAEGLQVIKSLENFGDRLLRKNEEIASHPNSIKHLSDLTDTVLPKDGTVIQISPVQTALDVDLDLALDNLFYQLVEKYT